VPFNSSLASGTSFFINIEVSVNNNSFLNPLSKTYGGFTVDDLSNFNSVINQVISF
jgi:hypothetical protein